MHITINRFLTIAVITFTFSSACFGTNKSQANEPSTAKASQSGTAQKLTFDTQINSDAIRAAKAELRAEMYKDSADSLKWALGIIIGLVIIFVGYAVFKDTREYRQAVADAKQALSQAREASKEARDASDKARDWEEKAREKLASIDEKVADKLKEIEAKGKASITDLAQEGKKQRKISELFTKGINAHQRKDDVLAAEYFEQIVKIDPTNVPALNNWSAALGDLARTKEGDEASNLSSQSCEKCERVIKIKPNFALAYNNWAVALITLAETKEDDEAYGLLGQACEKCVKAIKIKPNYAEAYNSWGAALAEQGKIKSDDKLFEQAYEKYKKTVELKPSYLEARNNWGAALLHQARIKTGKKRKNLLDEAKEKCLKAESIKTGEGSYNLACVCASLDDEKECKKWLKTGEQAGTLSTRKHAMGDDDLKSVRSKQWFKEIRWKGE